MPIMMAVYSRTGYPTDADLLCYLGNIEECAGQQIDAVPQFWEQRRGDLYCTTFRVMDARFDLPDFYMMFLPPITPAENDVVGLRRVAAIANSETGYWYDLFGTMKLKDSYMTALEAGSCTVLVFETDLTILSNMFVESKRNKITLIPPPK